MRVKARPPSGKQPEGAPLFNRYASSYDDVVGQAVSFSGQGSEFFARAKLGLLKDLITAHMGSTRGIHLLDVGCGTGNLHAGLVAEGLQVTGVDVADGSLEVARSKNPGVQYDLFDGCKLPFQNGSFDVSMAICVFHHVRADLQLGLIAEMSRITRLGGLVVVIEHNPVNPLTRLAVWRCPFDKDAALLSARQSKMLMASTGIATNTRYFLFLPLQNRISSLIERNLWWLCLGAQYCTYGINRESRAT